MSGTGPSGAPPPTCVNDVDLRTGKDLPDEYFPRRIFVVLQKGKLYAPSKEVTAKSTQAASKALEHWWKDAELKCKELGHPHLVRQTEWLKQFNKVYYNKVADLTLVEYLSREADSPQGVQSLTQKLLDEGGVPQPTYPGMMMFIDAETQRGMVATIPLLPGVMVGQFLGSMKQNHDGNKFTHNSELEGNYSINFNYAGEDFIINPIKSVPKPAGAGGGPSRTEVEVESGAFLNEPRTDKKGLHGKIIKDKRQREWHQYNIDPNSLTVALGGKKKYALDGMQWDYRPFYTDGTLSANTNALAWKRSKHSKPRRDADALPPGWRFLDDFRVDREDGDKDRQLAKRFRTLEPHAVRSDSGIPVPLADVVVPDAVRQKLVANVECNRAELPLCFYTLQDQNRDRRCFFKINDALHADMAVKMDQVYGMCDKYARVWSLKGGKRTPTSKFELHNLVGRKKDDRRAIQAYDILHLKDDNDTFVGCERFVVVLPLAKEFEGAFEYDVLKKWAVQNKKTPADIAILRFYRRKDAWCCPERQVGVQLNDGRYKPYPWYRVGILPILPGQELLFLYQSNQPTKKYGLLALGSDDVTQNGPLWSHTHTV